MFGIPLTAAALKASLWGNVVLGVLLIASVSANVLLVRSIWINQGEEQGKSAAAKELATQVGKVEALAESAERSAEVADQAKVDQAWLMAELGTIVERGRERVTVYRNVVKTLPPAACPPGQERMDATNGILK